MNENINQIHSAKYKLLLVGALAGFVGTLDASIVNVSLPTLSRSFSVPIDMVAWVVLAYSLAITSTLLLIGRMAVKKGYRFAYVTGFYLFTFGSLLCALSSSIGQLIGSRILQGIGASFLMASGPALMTRAFPANERGKGMGTLATAIGAGLMSGRPLGGFIISSVGWHWIFLINIPIGIFGALYASRTTAVLTPDDPSTRVDYWGGFFQAAAGVLFLLFLNRLSDPQWSALLRYGVLAGFLIALVGFFWRELRAEYPLLGLSIFKYKQFTIAISVMMITFTCNAAALLLIPFYLEELLRLVPGQVGLVLVTIPICTIVVAPLSGRLSDTIGYRLLTNLGLAIFILSMFWRSTLVQNSTRLDVIFRLVLMGVGLGIFQSPNSSSMMSAVPREVVGIASGLLATARNLGLAVGVAVSTAIFIYRKNLYLQSVDDLVAFAKSFHWVVMAFGLLAIVAILISYGRVNRVANNTDSQ